MFTFNNENIITGYIKQVLHSFNLPLCRVFDNESLAKNYYSNSEGVCIIGKYSSENPLIAHVKNNQIIKSIPYIFGKYYQNITTTLYVYNNIYDYKSHIYLGNYLRFIRDYLKINLMSMYNCFSGETIVENGYKYLIIPIKYNKEYTIAYTCSNYQYLFTNRRTDNDIIEEFNDKPSQSKTSTFTDVYYLKSANLKDNNEDSYKLVIKTLEENSDNIIVLEGKYSNIDYTKYQFNFSADVSYNDIDLNKLISNIQLLSKQAEMQKLPICFADKLVEYLTDMCITPTDKISRNIIDAKYKVYERYGNNPDPVTGENKYPHTPGKLGNLNSSFDNNLRVRFIDALNQTQLIFKNTYDILGYVDKDIEEVIDDETRDIEEK